MWSNSYLFDAVQFFIPSMDFLCIIKLTIHFLMVKVQLQSMTQINLILCYLYFFFFFFIFFKLLYFVQYPLRKVFVVTEHHSLVKIKRLSVSWNTKNAFFLFLLIFVTCLKHLVINIISTESLKQNIQWFFWLGICKNRI